jgi:CPA2 family monovalent cation:H+ antiporter-2
MPEAADGNLDMAAAPRRAFVVTLQLGIVLLAGLPLLAVLQPFIDPLRGAVALLCALVLLGVAFWRSAANLDGHIRAVSEVIVEILTRQGRGDEAESDADRFKRFHEILPGLGNVVSVRIGEAGGAAGKSLAALNLGGLTGATVLVLMRGKESRIPTGKDVLAAGDLLALAGTPEAIRAAREILGGS